MIRSIICLALLLPLITFGDAMVMTRAMTASTIAEIYIEKDQVRVALEIGIADIPGFKNILPDAIYEKMGNEPAPVVERIIRFFDEDFVVEADGEILRGGIRQMEPRSRLKRDEITGEPLPNQGGGEGILFAEFVFPMVGNPESLSIHPPKNEQGFTSASIGMMVYHRGLPVMDFRYLSRKETIVLDWDDPWYSRFENKNLWRQYNEPISVFLYAEHSETRVEVIVRPKDIQQWHELGIQGMETIPVEMQSELKQKVADFLKKEINLTIDGEQVAANVQRVSFLKRTLKSSIVIDPPEELDAISATLGVIFSVPTETLPQESSVTWNLFSPKMQVVRAAATDEAGPLPYKLSPDDNVLVWKNFLKHPTIPSIKALAPPQTTKQIRVPLGTILCLILFVPLVRTMRREKGKAAAGLSGGVILACAVFIYPFLAFPITVPSSPELSDEAATELVSGLLENVYTSFDFRDESTIYDALDRSLVGDLLTEVYLQTKKSLELASQGGAQVKVKGINLESAEFQPLENGVKATCVWDVMGSVGHWGHIHQRVNRYSAELSIKPIDGQWKITMLEILEEQRVK